MFTISKQRKQYLAGTTWYHKDEEEFKELFGWTIDKCLDIIEDDFWVIEHDSRVVSAMSIDFDGRFTYVVSDHPLGTSMITYIRYLARKIDLYQELAEVDLITEVSKKHIEGIKVLKLLGFTMTSERKNRYTYGKQKQNN